MNTFLLVCVILEVLCLGAYYQYRTPVYQFRSLRREDDGDLGKKVAYFEVYRNGQRQSCGQMAKRLVEPAFVRELTFLFATHPDTTDGKFFYFMCTPFQTNYLNRPFTFFIVSEPLRGIGRASFDRYKEYVDISCAPESTSKVMVFHSKQEPSTVLVSPCPSATNPTPEYGFIGDFMQNASMNEKVRLFNAIGVQLAIHMISPEGKRGVPMFISTHGLDVPWLHVRLETPLPKHYNTFKKDYDLLP